MEALITIKEIYKQIYEKKILEYLSSLRIYDFLQV